MKIVSVNFRCMVNTEVHIKNGLVLLRGESASGKTTVLESIYYALYGTLRDQYSHGEKSCSVTVHFNPDIIIQRNSGPGRLQLHVGERKYDGAQAQQIIDSLFGNEAIFVAGCYLQQGEKCPLLTGTNEEKMALLRAISFRDEHVEEVQDRISSKLKEMQSQIVTAEREYILSQRTFDALKREYPSLETNIDTSDLDIDELMNDVKKITLEIDVKEKQLKRILQIEAKLESLTKIVVDTVEPDISMERDLDDDLEKIKVRESEINVILNKIELDKKLKKSREDQVRGLEELKATLLQLKTQHGLSEDTYRNELDRISSNREIQKKIKHALSEFGAQNVGELRGQIGAMGSKIEEMKIQVRELEQDLDAKKWNADKSNLLSCPSCNVQLCLEDHGLKLVGSGAPIELKPLKNPDVSEELITGKKRELESIVMKRTKIQDNLSELTKLSMRVTDESPTDNEKFSACQQMSDVLNKIAITESLIPKNLDESPIEEVDFSNEMAELKSRRESIMVKKIDIAARKANFERNRKTQLEIEALKGELGSNQSQLLEDEISKLKESLVETKEMHTLALNIIKKIELESKFNRDKKTLDDINRKVENLKRLQSLAKQTEIAILERSVEVINEQTNQFLSVMFPEEHKMTVRYSTTKETKGGKERMTCSVNIFYKNVIYDKYKRLSGGEKDRLSLAITLAINSLMDGKILLLDETLNTLDSNSKLRILEMLKTFAGDKRKCLIASHDIVEGIFDSILNF